MIIYEDLTWVQVGFAWAGTIWPHIFSSLATWALVASGCYALFDYMDIELTPCDQTFLGSTMSFLLIFRANQSYKRYWLGRTLLACGGRAASYGPGGGSKTSSDGPPLNFQQHSR